MSAGNHTLTVFSRCNKGGEFDYHDWYSHHMRSFLSIPSILSAQRFVRVATIKGEIDRDFMGFYTVQTDDIPELLEKMRNADTHTPPMDAITSPERSFTNIFWRNETPINGAKGSEDAAFSVILTAFTDSDDKAYVDRIRAAISDERRLIEARYCEKAMNMTENDPTSSHAWFIKFSADDVFEAFEAGNKIFGDLKTAPEIKLANIWRSISKKYTQ